MKKLITLVAVLSIASLLFADYTVIIPEHRGEYYSLMAENGEILPLDDYVYYKRWNGLLAENLGEGIYRIEEDGNSVIVVMNGVSESTLDAALHFENADTAILPESFTGFPGILGDAGVSEAVFLRRLSDLERRLYENEGITVSYIRPGALLDITDGLPAIADTGKTITVTCPECGHSFTLYLP